MSYENLSPADYAAINGNNNNGWGGFGDGGWWIILLFLFAGWGGRGFGGGFGGGCDAPCATQADVRSAVDQQTLISKLDQQTYGLADSTYALNNTINGNFRTLDGAICNLGYQALQNTNALQSQLAECCCTTKQAIADVKYTVGQEACETRHAMYNNTRDIIENANANSRAILDFLTNDKIATLTAENQGLKLAASQSNQNAVLMAAMDANKAEILRRTGAECPTAAYIVQPPTPVTFPTNCCGQATYGGCGNGCF